MASWTVCIYGVLAVASFVVYRVVQGRITHNTFPPPPGPKPVPLLGNIFDLPAKDVPEFRHWLNHKRIYGGISSVSVLGMTLVMIHDRQVAYDLLERPATSRLTSGRPMMVFANKLCGFDSIMLALGYNETFRRYRTMMHRELGTPAAAAKFGDVQALEVRKQLVRILDWPDQLLQHFHTTTGATILEMTYGYTADPSGHDKLVLITEQMMTEFSLAAVPMTWMVDIVPALQYLPDWLPGTSFKKTARRWRHSIMTSAYAPFRFAQGQIAQGTNRESYVSRQLDQCTTEHGALSKDDEHSIVWTAETLYGAASDTTVTTLTAFTLAMLRFPDVQRKAQAEIDRVVGRRRLPTLADRASLPYIDSIVKETLRWWPLAPLGFPHRADDNIDYEYEKDGSKVAMTIPKGAYLMPAVWWFLNDPAVYADPESFDPARFLPPRSEPDPAADAFGYGRRICPGRFFADAGLYLNMVQILATFTLKKAVDKDGNDVGVDDVVPKPGVLSYPTPFQFAVEPRDEEAKTLIESIRKECPDSKNNSKDVEEILRSPNLFGDQG